MSNVVTLDNDSFDTATGSIKWDEKLVDSLARRKAVIMIGAGVSQNSINKDKKRPATWVNFLKICCDAMANDSQKEVILDLINKEDFLTACELIKLKIGDKIFYEHIINEYKSPGYDHAKIHEYIFNLDASIVISPNFDCIYENFAIHQTRGSIIIKPYTSKDIAKYIRGGNNRLIIKSHGNADTPEELIFTRKDYANARVNHALFYEILKSLALTHTFLFLGCGINDPDIRMIFEDIRFAYGNSLPEHYMTIPKHEAKEGILSLLNSLTNINFYEYSHENCHIDLTLSLKDLCDQVEEAREKIASFRKW